MSQRNRTVVGLEALLGPRFPTKRARRATPAIVVQDTDAATWAEAGDRLRMLDPARYRRLLALAQGIVSLHAPELESEDEFAVRLVEIAGGARGAS